MIKKILVFEPQSSGHRNEYLAHLLNYIQHIGFNREYYFLINRESYNVIVSQGLDLKKVHFLRLDKAFDLNAQDAVEIINKYVTEYHINEVLVMDLRLFKNSISDIRSFKKINIPKKGILFNSYHRVFYKNIFDLFFLKKIYRKFLFSLLTFLNPSLKLCILNDKRVVNDLKHKKRFTQRVSFLPDPIDRQAIRKSTKKRDHKFKVLLFGSLDARKNLCNISKAIILLSNEHQAILKLIIKGKIRKPYKEEAYKIIKGLQEKTKIEIEMEDKFVSEKERNEAFSSADLVLIIYQNFYGSSGVLGHAALFNKPVLASSYGLVSDLVRQNDLGKCVSPDKPKEIAQGLRFFMEVDNIKIDGTKYLKHRSPSDFAKILLN